MPIGSVEPHYFAGFTGGRKSILPGVASYETVERNHSHALDKGVAPQPSEVTVAELSVNVGAARVINPHNASQKFLAELFGAG